MSLLMKLTHNSLATIIAWVSTCLLAGGASTLFSESARTTWMTWGSFGLAAAIGLDVAARVRDRMRMDAMKITANKRFDRDISFETQENEANTAIRASVVRILGRMSPKLKLSENRRTQERYPCNLDVELLADEGRWGNADHRETCTRRARVSNLSESGFELSLAETMPQQRMTMTFAAANGERETLLGEMLWCSPQPDGSFVVGGRFLSVVAVKGV